MHVSFQAPNTLPLREVQPGMFFIDGDGDLCLMAIDGQIMCFSSTEDSAIPFLFGETHTENNAYEMVTVVNGPITFQG